MFSISVMMEAVVSGGESDKVVMGEVHEEGGSGALEDKRFWLSGPLGEASDGEELCSLESAFCREIFGQVRMLWPVRPQPEHLRDIT